MAALPFSFWEWRGGPRGRITAGVAVLGRTRETGAPAKARGVFKKNSRPSW